LIGGGGGGGGGGTVIPCAGCVDDASLANAYSGVGSCAATKFATTLTRNAAPTCTQPNFTDLAGTATAAQEPLATLLAGRAGTGNDTTLSTDGTVNNGGTLYGSATTAKSLILRANSADLTTGDVIVNAPAVRTPGILQFDPDATPGKSYVQFFDGTETFAGAVVLDELTSGTYTMNNASSSMSAFSAPLTVVLDWTVAPSFASSFFFAGPKVRASTAISSRLFRPFLAAPTFDANAATLTLTDNGMFEATPTYTITSAGVIAGSQRGFYTTATVGTSATLPQWRGYVFDDATGAGAVTTQVGVDIAALSKATTNIGIRNADTTVLTPCTLTVTAGATIAPACSLIEMTAAGAVTCSTATCISDGVNGQILTLFNTSVNVITIDGTGGNVNLSAAGADYAMGQRDSLTVMFSTTLADWIEISRSNN
jgi:hypothetical protein